MDLAKLIIFTIGKVFGFFGDRQLIDAGKSTERLDHNEDIINETDKAIDAARDDDQLERVRRRRRSKARK